MLGGCGIRCGGKADSHVVSGFSRTVRSIAPVHLPASAWQIAVRLKADTTYNEETRGSGLLVTLI